MPKFIVKNKIIQGFVNRYFPQGSITQYFGENVALYSKICVAENQCLYGGHNGIDIVAPWGTEIFSVEDGIVVETKESPNGYEKHVRILSMDRNREWIYGHLAEIRCVLGQTIGTKACLGTMGNTGFVVSGPTPFWKYNPYAGTHCHLGLRLFKEWNGEGTYNMSYPNGTKGTILNYDNGFLGSVNFGFEESEEDEKMQKQLTVISLANQV